MNRRFYILFVSFLGVIYYSSAQNVPTISLDSIDSVIDKALIYLEDNQKKDTKEGNYYAGEWPSYMCLEKGFVLLGLKKRVYDSNCFSVASIHNALSKTYLEDSSKKIILKMLPPAHKRIMSYRNGDNFNFWNLLPPNRDLKKGVKYEDQPLVRRPTNYPLKSRYINNAANIEEDADDTSLGYMANALFGKIFGHNDSTLTKDIAPIFDNYRDINRKNRHWYNWLNTNDHNTGAYLTWHGKEYEFKRKWKFAYAFIHNKFFFMKWSSCYPHPYVPYIPYGTNDLDGVVNANVLSSLSINNQLENAKAKNDVINYLNRKAARKRYSRVGVYYPNRYQFPFAVTQAYSNGVYGLEPAINHFIEYLLKNQNKDGSWSARAVLQNKDKLQSTIYALHTLVHIGNFEKNNTLPAIQRAIGYIFGHINYTDKGIYWKGGVFFSGGTVVRNALIWKSDAYTTAIAVQALAKYKTEMKKIQQTKSVEN